MREAHPTERAVGVDYYVSDTDGIGGRLRSSHEDFVVRELEGVTLEPLDADATVYDNLVIRVTLSGWDTNEFARSLSNHLGISRERISWAGTKDKHAQTTQLFSVKGIDPPALPSLAEASIEPVGRLGRRLLLGDLAGNEFSVTVHDPDRPEQAAEITRELRGFVATGTTNHVGVPNYFGQQRFGSTRPVTHEVGLRIIERDWQGAVLSYVGNPRDDEPAAIQDARAFVEDTHDWKAGLERMPDSLRYERSILHHLAATGGDTPRDFQSALESLPVNLQQLFVHAAQSYVFNHIVSRRLERGLPFTCAVEGDVVCFSDEVAGIRVPDTDRLHRVTGRIDTVNRHLSRGRAFITAPLVGTDTAFGGGTPGEIERDVVAELEISPRDFALPGPFGSSGTRRAILAQTAIDRSTDPLTFSFALPKGSYATVLLREYLKCPPELL